MASEMNRWLVPDGIEDILPHEAEQVEHWRRVLLDELRVWGYELVMPPLVEFVQALLTGKASDLDLDTCQLVDQASGRMMGIRADMTPQVARIDAHRLKQTLPVRLCYTGEVLRALPAEHSSSRSPIQVGAELFGHANVQSDIEVMELMLSACQRIGVQAPTLVLGHVGIYRALTQHLNLTEAQSLVAQDMLQRKSLPEWSVWVDALSGVSARLKSVLHALPMMCGDATSLLPELAKTLSGIDANIDLAVARLNSIVKHIRMTHPTLPMQCDIADLRGFQYHTGVVFGLIEGQRQRMIASGGRYDDIGAAFGRARPATGFSLDLRQLLDLDALVQPTHRKRYIAPAVADMALVQVIERMRREGHCVVIGFPDVDWASQRKQVDGELVQDNGRWVLR